MAKYSIDSSTLTDIANAIRTQYGEDSPIAVTDMAEAILGIEGGGGESTFQIVEFSVVQNTAEMQEFDFELTEGATDYEIFILPKGWLPSKFQTYTILGRIPYASNNVLASSYVGAVVVTQNSNCPFTKDIENGHATYGPCAGSYRFRPNVIYEAIILPRKDFTV